MTTFYVAGSTKEFDRVRSLVRDLEILGLECAYDWTSQYASKELLGWGPRCTRYEQAAKEVEAAASCDILILLWHPRVYGAMIETGAALASGREVWVVGPERRWFRKKPRQSIFWHLPNVYKAANVAALKTNLALKMSEQHNRKVTK